MLTDLLMWIFHLLTSLRPKPPPMPGQTWFVAGIGRCVILDVFCNQRLSNDLEWDVNYISYQRCDGGLFATVKRTSFLTNSELVPDEEWSEFLKYKQRLKENRIH